MKSIIVIGLGSMGKRRIRLIKKIGGFHIAGIDKQSSRRKEVEERDGIKTFEDIDSAVAAVNPECAVICTSPLSHASIINECLKNGLHVFTELNLVSDMYEENIALAKKMDIHLFMSSTFLYRKEIDYIANAVEKAKCNVDYIYHVGQYLPDWHPWESYKDFFIGDVRTNGCREILAIELPWLQKVFGEIESFDVQSSKNTGLNIEYKDNYLIMFQHKGGHKGVVAVDVVSRKPMRYFEVYGEEIHLFWNGETTGLIQYNLDSHTDEKIDLYDDIDKLEGYNSFIIENEYENELKSFFDTVYSNGIPKYSFEDDLVTLNIIDEIEEVKGC